MIANLIPAPYRWLAYAILASALVLAGLTAGIKATAAHYRPKLAEAEAQAATWQSAYHHAGQQLQIQNAAVDQLEADGERRAQAAAQAVQQARAAAADYRTRAAAISTARPPAGVDLCQAARQAFDDELREERGK